MRTAVDSSVLLDVLIADPDFGERSARALRTAVDEGVVVACEVVWAEVRAQFDDSARFERALALIGVDYDPIGIEAAAAAGARWREYCRRLRRSERSRPVADFLIGAHARHQADVLLARDRGFWGVQWSDLRAVDPSDS